MAVIVGGKAYLSSSGQFSLQGMRGMQHITFFISEGFQALDLFGPLDAFAIAQQVSGWHYELSVAAPQRGPVRSGSGTSVLADSSLDEIQAPDTLVIVGGSGPRAYSPCDAERAMLHRAAKGARRICSVCTGTFLLCRLGLADGRRVATHWRHVAELAAAYPKVTVDANALFVQDGHLWTSAGITAGIDLALAMIAEDAGPAVSAAVARQLVVYVRRPGDQAQFSAPLAAQSGTSDRLGQVIAWMADRLDEPLGVEVLAGRAAMSPRHFGRLFRERTGTTPARFVERLRLDRARTMLAQSGARVSAVASAAGYQDPDTFRRAFERCFSTTPSEYRERFGIAETTIEGDAK